MNPLESMNALLGPLAAVLVVALPQSDPRQGQEGTPLFVPSREALDPSTVVVRYFNPVAIEAQELVGCANELFGGELKIRAGIQPEEGEVTLPRFVVLRNTLVIRDLAPAAASIAKLLSELDAAEQVRQRQQTDLERQTQEQAAVSEREQAEKEALLRGELADTMVEVRPHYVSLATLVSALEPFQRQVTYTSGGSRGWVTNSVTQMPDAQMIVVCESRERADRLVKLVEQIDRPQPQALVSVTLVRASEAEAAERRGAGTLPKELTDNLRQLVPYGAFEPLAVGFLRCSLATGRQSELKMDLGKGVGGKGVGSFSFIPEAFSPETAEITLSQCQFNLDLPPEREGEEGVSHSFTTNLTFKSGEYVVLGAVGARPIFVVLRTEPVKRSN